MPRSCIEGLIGSILGLSSDEYPEKLKNANIALQIINEVRKISLPVMNTHTDYWSKFGAYIGVSKKNQETKSFRTPARIECLRNPHFRLYFDEEHLIDDLEKKLRDHQTVFFPYLGTNSMISNFGFINSYDYTDEKLESPIGVSTIIPFFGKIPQIYPEKGVAFAIEQNLPLHLTNKRILTGSYSAVYSPQGKPIKVCGLKVQKVLTKEEDVFVTFIPSQVPS
jgi:CRISPR-associated protein Cas5 subtype I-B